MGAPLNKLLSKRSINKSTKDSFRGSSPSIRADSTNYCCYVVWWWFKAMKTTFDWEMIQARLSKYPMHNIEGNGNDMNKTTDESFYSIFTCILNVIKRNAASWNFILSGRSLHIYTLLPFSLWAFSFAFLRESCLICHILCQHLQSLFLHSFLCLVSRPFVTHLQTSPPLSFLSSHILESVWIGSGVGVDYGFFILFI